MPECFGLARLIRGIHGCGASRDGAAVVSDDKVIVGTRRASVVVIIEAGFRVLKVSSFGHRQSHSLGCVVRCA